MFLYPRLLPAQARQRADQLVGMSLEALVDEGNLEQRFVVYGATGGNKAPEGHLQTLQKKLRDLGISGGYPGELDRHQRTVVDAEMAVVLHGEMKLSPAEASHMGVWAFMACHVTPELVRWRFPGDKNNRSSPRRFLGGKRGLRNMFGRLWWRAELLHIDGEDPYLLLKQLGEDELVQITERPALAGCKPLAVGVAQVFLETFRGFEGVSRSDLMRDAMKRLRRLLPLTAFDVLSPEEIQWLLRELFQASARHLGGTPRDTGQMDMLRSELSWEPIKPLKQDNSTQAQPSPVSEGQQHANDQMPADSAQKADDEAAAPASENRSKTIQPGEAQTGESQPDEARTIKEKPPSSGRTQRANSRLARLEQWINEGKIDEESGQSSKQQQADEESPSGSNLERRLEEALSKTKYSLQDPLSVVLPDMKPSVLNALESQNVTSAGEFARLVDAEKLYRVSGVSSAEHQHIKEGLEAIASGLRAPGNGLEGQLVATSLPELSRQIRETLGPDNVARMEEARQAALQPDSAVTRQTTAWRLNNAYWRRMNQARFRFAKRSTDLLQLLLTDLRTDRWLIHRSSLRSAYKIKINMDDLLLCLSVVDGSFVAWNSDFLLARPVARLDTGLSRLQKRISTRGLRRIDHADLIRLAKRCGLNFDTITFQRLLEVSWRVTFDYQGRAVFPWIEVANKACEVLRRAGQPLTLNQVATKISKDLDTTEAIHARRDLNRIVNEQCKVRMVDQRHVWLMGVTVPESHQEDLQPQDGEPSKSPAPSPSAVDQEVEVVDIALMLLKQEQEPISATRLMRKIRKRVPVPPSLTYRRLRQRLLELEGVESSSNINSVGLVFVGRRDV